MAGKAPPCVTLMLCVAGCSSTTSGTLPHSRTLPPPNFDVNGVAARTTEPVWDRPPATAVAARPETPVPTAKPNTVDVPVEALQKQPSKRPVLATQFETVPDSYLALGSTAFEEAAKRPFFTPLKSTVTPSPNTVPKIDAQAVLKPLTAELPPNAVVVPEPIAYPQYVSVGPEYFGLGSDIAPYVLDPTQPSREREERFAQGDPVALRPQWPEAEETQTQAALSPMPRQRPSKPLPEQPAPDIQIAAVVPPRPEPSPKRVPTEPMPRPKPIRKTETPPPETATEKTRYRVRIDPEQTDADAVVASLGIAPPIVTEPLPDLSVVTSDDLADEGIVTPTPRRKPPQRASVRFSGSTTTDPAITQAIATQPANDSAARVNCHVSQGSNDRMILICEGIDVPQAHVFRSVVEGESAFRGLRPFDAPESVITRYGFNAERFNAMSQGPRSARDLAFLRALRKSGKSIRVKGRDFEMYLMKGDHSLATVLVEQVATPERLNAVGQ